MYWSFTVLLLPLRSDGGKFDENRNTDIRHRSIGTKYLVDKTSFTGMAQPT